MITLAVAAALVACIAWCGIKLAAPRQRARAFREELLKLQHEPPPRAELRWPHEVEHRCSLAALAALTEFADLADGGELPLCSQGHQTGASPAP